AVEPFRRGAPLLLGEYDLLELGELILDRVDHREELIDHEVHDGVEPEGRPLGEEVRRALAPVPDLLVRRRLPMADRDQEPLADEAMRLPRADLPVGLALHRA